MTSYAVDASGRPAQTPATTIAGPHTGIAAPSAIALDAAGDIYVANQTTVTVYPPNPLGTLDEAPIATIDVTTNNGGLLIYGMNVDASGRIYVAYPGGIVVYAANPRGTVTTPIATITGSNTMLAEVHDVGFDASGRIYATDNVWGIDVFAPNPSGTVNEAPVARIPRDGTTTLSYPWGVFVSPAGRITTVDAARILVFAPVATGTVSEAPLATIAGSNTQLDGGNDGLTVGPDGTIYEANERANSILLFAANPVGTLDEAPFATISGAGSGVSGPRGVAVLQHGAATGGRTRRR